MAAALIVIEIAAPKVSDDALSVLVSACSRAARDAECVLARNASDQQPAAVAIVSLQSEDKIRIEVGVRQGDHDSWRTKDFAFVPADERMDRWRAVGFAIGTLAESTKPEQDSSVRVAPSPSSAAGASSASPSASSAAGASSAAAAPSSAAGASSAAAAPSSAAASSQPADDTADERQRPVRARPQSAQMFIGASALFGPGIEDSSWRLGGALYFDLAPTQLPVFFTVGGSAATGVGGSSELSTRWFDISLGAGVPLLGRLDASGLELRAQALVEYFDAEANVDSHSQRMSRWTVGGQGAFAGRLQIVPNWLLTADVQAAGLAGETAVSVGGEPVGSSASFRYLGSLGLRIRVR